MIAQWQVVEHIDTFRAALDQIRSEFDAGQVAHGRERLRQLHLQVGLLHAATSAGVALDDPKAPARITITTADEWDSFVQNNRDTLIEHYGSIEEATRQIALSGITLGGGAAPITTVIYSRPKGG